MAAAMNQWVRPAAKRLPPELRGKVRHKLPGRGVGQGSVRRTLPLGLRARRAKLLPEAEVRVKAHGKVLAGVAFLCPTAVQELTEAELYLDDRRFRLVVCACVSKPQSGV
jgi:hypothetical protein